MPAAVVELIEDLNQTPNDLYDSTWSILNQASVGNLTLFATATRYHGVTLWRTDGTEQGTFAIYGGAPYETTNNLWIREAIGNKVYFEIIDPLNSNERQLWVSDGTKAGTQLLMEGATYSVIPYRDGVAFAETSNPGVTIYTTDGTVSGTRQLTQFPSVNFNSITATDQGQLFVVTSKYDAAAQQSLETLQVVTSEGESTALLTTAVGSRFSSIVDVKAVGEVAYFSLGTVSQGFELWRTDGTITGTDKIVNPIAGERPFEISLVGAVGENFVFSAKTAQGANLWSLTEEDETGTKLSQFTGQNLFVSDLKFFNGRMLLILNGELWETDASVSGTRKIAGTDPSQFSSTSPFFSRVFITGQNILLQGFDRTHGREMWTSDGTEEGTQLLREFSPGLNDGVGWQVFPQTFQNSLPRLMFSPKDGLPGNKIWISDGTQAGTRHLLTNVTGTDDSNPTQLLEHDGDLFFSTSQPSGVGSVFRVQQDSVERVHDYATLSSRNETLNFIQSSEDTAFDVSEWSGGVLRSIEVQPSSFLVHDLFQNVKGKQIVSGAFLPPGTFRQQLRVLQDDGSTSVLAESSTGLYVLPHSENDVLYFLRAESNELWRTDGTSEGTLRLAFGVQLVTSPFNARWGGTQWTVFPLISDSLISDGTAAGTRYLSEYLPEGVGNRGLGMLGENYLFGTFDTGGVDTLWKFDGVRVQPITRKVFPTGPSVVSDDHLYFWGQSDVNSRQWELWKTDGTEPGTQLVFALDEGIRPWEEISNFTSLSGRLLFYVWNREIGRNVLWTSDGTEAGTLPLRHTLKGQLILDDQPMFTEYRGGIAFRAATEEYGVEVFRIANVPDLQPPSKSDIRIESTASSFRVNWPDTQGALQYDVLIRDLRNPDRILLQTRVSHPEFLADHGLDQGGYRLWIRSVPFTGEPSAWSLPVEFGAGQAPTLYPVEAESTVDRPVFRWVAPTDQNSYEVWLTHRDTKTRVLYVEGVSVQTLTVPRSLPLGRYAVWVRGTRSDGTKSEWSSLTEFHVLNSPIRLTAGAKDWKTNQVTFQWPAVPGATSYNIEIRSDESSHVVHSVQKITSTTYSASLNAPAGKYRVLVKAFKGSDPHSVSGIGDGIWLKLAPTKLRHSITEIAWDAAPTAVTYSFELRNLHSGLVVPVTTQTGTSFRPPGSFRPGQYSLRVFANYPGASSNWSEPYSFEFFRPPVEITSSTGPTADATPLIRWTAAPDATRYEFVIKQSGSTKPAYSQSTTDTFHRVNKALAPGEYQMEVRALFPDGSRSTWSPVRTISIGTAVQISSVDRSISWTALDGATHYEIWINRLDPRPEAKIIHELIYTGTRFSLPSALPRGRYQVWIRAIRAEAGEQYLGRWGTLLFSL